MRILQRLFGSNGKAESEKPPKPDDAGERESKTVEATVYELTVEYRNGDIETFECYSRRSDEYYFEYAVDVYPYAGWQGQREPTLRREWDSIHYSTLNREPKIEEKYTEKYRVEWVVEYREELMFNGSFDKWEKHITEIEMEQVD